MDLTNIGTLFAFVLVSAGVIVLRRTEPDRPRPFRVPWVPVTPLISIVACVYLMWQLPHDHLDPVRRLAGDRTRPLLRLRLQPLHAAPREAARATRRDGGAQGRRRWRHRPGSVRRRRPRDSFLRRISALAVDPHLDGRRHRHRMGVSRARRAQHGWAATDLKICVDDLPADDQVADRAAASSRTLVVGIAGHGDDMKRVGRLALRSIIYFEIVTTLALVVGLDRGEPREAGPACVDLGRRCGRGGR